MTRAARQVAAAPRLLPPAAGLPARCIPRWAGGPAGRSPRERLGGSPSSGPCAACRGQGIPAGRPRGGGCTTVRKCAWPGRAAQAAPALCPQAAAALQARAGCQAHRAGGRDNCVGQAGGHAACMRQKDAHAQRQHAVRLVSCKGPQHLDGWLPPNGAPQAGYGRQQPCAGHASP